MPRKRKSLCDEIDWEAIGRLYRDGWTDTEISDLLGVKRRTFSDWKRIRPEFGELVAEWKEIADQRVERALFERAVGYSVEEERPMVVAGEVQIVRYRKHIASDPTSMIFWLKNRKKEEWNDQVQVTGNNGGPIETKELSDDEYARRIAFALAGATRGRAGGSQDTGS